MKLLRSLTWRTMRRNRARSLATLVGILLSVALFTAVTIVGVSVWDYVYRATAESWGDYYICFPRLTQEQRDRLLTEEGLREAAECRNLGYLRFPIEGDTGYAVDPIAAVDKEYFSAQSVSTSMGRLPENDRELTVSMAAYRYLCQQGYDLGDTVELTLYDRLPLHFYEELVPDPEEVAFTREYTLVGVLDYGILFSQENLIYDGEKQQIQTACLTRIGAGDQPVWYRIYGKTADPRAVYDLRNGGYGETLLNDALLSVCGAGSDGAFPLSLGAIYGALIGVVLISAVWVISNAFSISVSQRAREFGLLASVGATRKQIRASVFTEAAILYALGLIGGLAAGLGLSLLCKALYGSWLEEQFSLGGTTPVRVVISPPALLLAAGISGAAVLLSAWKPARLAGKMAPIEAIRHSEEARKLPKRQGIRPWTYRLWGLPGVLARKYYAVHRRRYRSTVASLAVSVSLLLCVWTGCDMVTSAAEASWDLHTADFECFALAGSEGMPRELEDYFSRVEARPEVEESCRFVSRTVSMMVPVERLSEPYRRFLAQTRPESLPETGEILVEAEVVYVQDGALEAALARQGLSLDPTKALILRQRYTYPDTVDGRTRTRTVEGSPFADAPGAVTGREGSRFDIMQRAAEELMPGKSLLWDGEEHIGPGGASYVTFLEFGGAGTGELDHTYLPEVAGDQLRLYAYDPATGKSAAQPDLEMDIGKALTLTLGPELETALLGARTKNSLTLIYPLSALEGEDVELHLAIRVRQYASMRSYLGEEQHLALLQVGLGTSGTGSRAFLPDYTDYLGSEASLRGTLALVRGLSYGFAALIALLAAANVLNTVSTSLLLRRRDLGMLRSVGMDAGQMYRMMLSESVIYGVRALLWSVPVSLALCYGFYLWSGAVDHIDFSMPWGALGIGCFGVLALVLTTTVYSVARLRREAPMEAIRSDGI